MNYMKQVADMFGVKLNEPFEIRGGLATIQGCYLNESGLHDVQSNIMPKMLLKLLNGDAEIIKRQFRPKYDDEYWYINSYGETANAIMEDDTFDYISIYMGNCFRTEAEAAAHWDEIMAKFREVQE